MKIRGAGALTGLLCTFAVAAQAALPVIPAAPREGDATLQAKWGKEHEDFVARAKQGKIDILLLGDSITHRWPTALWEETFKPLVAERFGIEGDQVQHLLWRIQNGEMEGIKPKLAVLLIGTNNVPRPFTSDEIAGTVMAVVKTIREKSPGTKVLILGMLPRNELASNIMRDRIRLVNLLLAKEVDGRDVRFLDVGEVIMKPDGSLTRELTPDWLHPSPAAYELLMKKIGPVVHEMAGN